jgi:tetratricopeptide (TPR) repeat protein
LSCVWALIAWLAVLDALAVRDYVALLDDSGRSPPDALPLRRSAPADYADAQTWVRYALQLHESRSWQLRHTDIDNAPHGRNVHWNSAFAHLIDLGGRARSAATGEPFATATERSLAWFNVPLFLGLVILFSAWIARIAYRSHAHVLALRLFGEAMSLEPTTAMRAGIAWILATSTNDALRNGTAALAIAQPLVKNSPNDPALLDVLAAALAETGRFAEATSLADRMLSISRLSGDAIVETRARERLASYRAGRPWRR